MQIVIARPATYCIGPYIGVIVGNGIVGNGAEFEVYYKGKLIGVVKTEDEAFQLLAEAKRFEDGAK